MERDAQLLWRGAHPGDHLTLFVTAPETREYELIGHFTQSQDYGDVKILLQGRSWLWFTAITKV